VVTADQILVLERGHLVERGTHPQLLQLGGEYARLWRLQSEVPGEQAA
jgi:ABC-type multidrug transport system fused ATPase/permease subunit